MSRNFELLQSLGKLHEAFGSKVEGQGPSAPADGRTLSLHETSTPSKEDDATGPELGFSATAGVELTNLVQRVFLLPGGNAPRMVAFAAPEAGTGCSWICARVASILAAHAVGSVCVVDANLRTPGLHKYFGRQNHSGLSDALSRSEPISNYAQLVSRQNLWLLSCGSMAGGKVTLSSDLIQAGMTGLRERFRYTLLDAPPVNKYADAIVLGSLADAIILVLQANSSRRESVVRAIADLKHANVRVLGVVLNQRTFSIPGPIYRLI